MPNPLKSPESGFPRPPSNLTPEIREYIDYVISATIKAAIEHIKETTEATMQEDLAKLKTEILKEAFPDADATGHKRYHESEMEVAKERKALFKEIRSKAVTGVIWLMLGLGMTALWQYFKREVQR